MNKKLVTAGLVAGLSIGAVADAQACGATLFGTGQGSRFQAYRARIPANVLIYASTELSSDKAADAAVQDGLSRAGHKVTVVTDASALDQALKGNHYDVVIAAASDADTVAQRLDPAAARTHILPVVAASGGGSSVEGYAQTLRADTGIGHVLKALNKIMEAKLP